MDQMNDECIVYSEKHEMQVQIENLVVRDNQQQAEAESLFCVSRNCLHPEVEADYPHDNHNT